MTLDAFIRWVLNDSNHTGSYPKMTLLWVFNFKDQRNKAVYQLHPYVGLRSSGTFGKGNVEEAILISFNLLDVGLYWGQIP